MKRLSPVLLGILLLASSFVLGQVPISGLPSATLPLTGNEVVVLTQKTNCSLPNGCTRQAPVSSFSIGVNNITQGAGITLTPNPLTTQGSIAVTNPFNGFAAPSGLITLTPVTGTAVTAEHSDSTHALSQAIVPTWTGLHTFTAETDFNGAVVGNGATGGALGAGTFNMRGCFVNGVACSVSGGSVTTLNAGTGITLTPNPISTVGSIALTVPVVVSSGGTGDITLPVHSLLLGEGTSAVSSVAAMAVDTLLQGKGATVDPAAVAVGNCGSSTQALSYSTSTHTFGCQTISVGGIPGGSTTQMQYNNAGAFGGSSMTYSSNGAFAIAAPSSGIALQVGAVSGGASPSILSTGRVAISGSGAINNSEIDITNSDSGGGAWRIGDSVGGAAGNMYFYNSTNSRATLNISGAGNVVVPIPSGGVALDVNGIANSNTALLTASSTSNQSFGLAVQGGTSGFDYGLFVQSITGHTLLESKGDGTFFAGFNGTTSTITADATGHVTIATPANTTSPLTVSNARTTTTSVNALTLTDAASGAQTPGSGAHILWTSNGGGTDAALAFEVGGTGTNNESQIGFYTQASAGSGQIERVIIADDGGVIVGTPTGGDKGSGTINMTGCFVNNVACATGGSSLIPKGWMGTCTSGGCTTGTSIGVSGAASRSGVGTYVVTFTVAYGSNPVCVTSLFSSLGTATTASVSSTNATTVSIQTLTSALVPADSGFSVSCIG